MSSCNDRQLGLNLEDSTQELEDNPSELYYRFQERVLQLIKDQGLSDTLGLELQDWAQSYGFPVMASWCRQFFRDQDDQNQANACVLLGSFGMSFRGDVVGHIGRDLLMTPLHATNVDLRGVAINVLIRWLEYDEDGMWFDMGEQHLEKEMNESLHECLGFALARCLDGEFLEEEEKPQDPLREEFFEVRRNCECELQGTFPILKIGPVLARLIELEPHVVSGILEILQVPECRIGDLLSQNHLGLLMTTVSEGGRLLRVWDTKGSFAFSVEPTATEDRWLLFAYLR